MVATTLSGTINTQGLERRAPHYSGVIDTDATWSGDFTFSNVTVAEGVTLIVIPGSRGEGISGATIYVEGTLIVGDSSGESVLIDSADSTPWGSIQVNSTGRIVVENTVFLNSTTPIYCTSGGVADLRDITVQGARQGVVVEDPENFTLEGADIRDIREGGVFLYGGGEGVLFSNVKVTGNGSNYPTVGMKLLGGSRRFENLHIVHFRPQFVGVGLYVVGRGVIHASRVVSHYCGVDLNVNLDGKLYVNHSTINSYGGSYFRHLPPGRCDVYYYDSYADSRRIHLEDEDTTFTAYRNVTVGAKDQMGKRLSFNLTVYPYGTSLQVPPTYQGFVEESIILWLPLFWGRGSFMVFLQPYNFTFISGHGYLHATIETAGVNWWMSRFFPTINLPPESTVEELVLQEDGAWYGSIDGLFTDPDGEDSLILISASLGEGIEVALNDGNLTVNPEENWSGHSWINLTVKDEFWNFSALEEYNYIDAYPLQGVNGTANITIAVSPENDPPILREVTYSNGTALGRRTVSAGEGEVNAWVAVVREDEREEFYVVAEDPDGDALTLNFTWVEGSGGDISLPGMLGFTFTPERNSTEGGLIRFNLSDSSTSIYFWVLIEVTPVNDPPYLPPEWNLSLNAGENLSIDLRSVIVDSDTSFDDLQISVYDTVAAFTSPYLRITGPPSSEDEVYVVEITVVDGEEEVFSHLTVYVNGTGEGSGEGAGEGGGEGGGEEGLNPLYVALILIAVFILLVLAVLVKRGGGEGVEE